MATDDFFRARLDSMIDMRHPLAVLATRMPWEQIETALAPGLCAQGPRGARGRRQRSVRPDRRPGGRRHQRPRLSALADPPAEFERVIVDTTVQEKAIAHPVDSRLLEIARHKVARAAKRCGIVLKQTFANEGKTLRRKARRLRSCQAVPPPAQDRQAPAHDPGCAHARCAARAESNFAGRCTRVGSRPGTPSIGVDAAANVARPRRTHPRPAASRQEQAVRASRTGGRMHLQGKARKPYEFGVKVSLTITHQHGLMVGARSFPSNPYDGHTLAAQLEQRWPSPPVAQSQTAAQFIRVWLMVTPV
jgi:hypothetical protein